MATSADRGARARRQRAVSNSVEHGYLVSSETLDHPGIVHLQERVVTSEDNYRRAVLTITDYGSWKTPEGRDHRGMGLLIMRACADNADVPGSSTGTRVVLTSRPIAAPHPV